MFRLYPSLFGAAKAEGCGCKYDTWLCLQHANRQRGGHGWLTIPDAIDAVLAVNPDMDPKTARNRVYELAGDDRFAWRSGRVICLSSATRLYKALGATLRDRAFDAPLSLCLSAKARRAWHQHAYIANRERRPSAPRKRKVDPGVIDELCAIAFNPAASDVARERAYERLKLIEKRQRRKPRPRLADKRGSRTNPLPWRQITRDLGITRGTQKEYRELTGLQVTENLVFHAIQVENGKSTRLMPARSTPEEDRAKGIYNGKQRAAHSYTSHSGTPASRYATKHMKPEVPNLAELKGRRVWHTDELEYSRDMRPRRAKSVLVAVEPGCDHWLRLVDPLRV